VARRAGVRPENQEMEEKEMNDLFATIVVLWCLDLLFMGLRLAT
jgi:hypothetical protein